MIGGPQILDWRLNSCLVATVTGFARCFDQKIILHSEGGGVYAGVVKPFVGRWHVTLEDEGQEWRLFGDWRVTDKQSALRLAASGIASPTGFSDYNGR